MIKSRNFLITALIAAFLFGILACEKDEVLSKKELLTLHIWKFEDMLADTDDQETQDLLTFVKLFMTTSTIDFGDDATYSWFIYDTTRYGTWELSTNGSLLTMDKGLDDESVQTLAELTEMKMVWETPGETTGREAYTLTMKWKK